MKDVPDLTLSFSTSLEMTKFVVLSLRAKSRSVLKTYSLLSVLTTRNDVKSSYF